MNPMQPVTSTFTTTVQQEQSNNWITVYCRSLCMHNCFVRVFLAVQLAGWNQRCFKVPSCALARPFENRNMWTRPKCSKKQPFIWLFFLLDV